MCNFIFCAVIIDIRLLAENNPVWQEVKSAHSILSSLGTTQTFEGQFVPDASSQVKSTFFLILLHFYFF